MNKYKRIGLFGGTFNPFHFGHLTMLNNFIDEQSLEKCLIIPTNVSPFKTDMNSDHSNNFHRLNMLKLLFENDLKVIIDDYEISKNEISYTINTTNYIIANYNPNELFLHIGADQVKKFNQWKSWEEIINKATLCISNRDDTNINEINNFIESISKIGKKPVLLSSPLIKISSTEIREDIKFGRSISGKVHPKAEKYIIENKIYQ
jgi:nicotinate-nucleotide adenylyltransferase